MYYSLIKVILNLRIAEGKYSMQQQNISIGTLVDIYERGELRLPENQRHYLWRATRVRGLLDSLYRPVPY